MFTFVLLLKKLGIKPGYKIELINAPENYFELLGNVPIDLIINSGSPDLLNFIHVFAEKADGLENQLIRLRKRIYQNGMIWVSWPKKSSKRSSDVNEDLIRKYALQIGLVDIKVCSVDETWSALKLVIPLVLRIQDNP
ncbi:MAG: DUF3052 family protein [Bacteroidetes bacterium]|nr:DUF3052 family protein [Bacteroidota bacterium]